MRVSVQQEPEMDEVYTELLMRRDSIAKRIIRHDGQLTDAKAEVDRHTDEIASLSTLYAQYEATIGLLRTEHPDVQETQVPERLLG